LKENVVADLPIRHDLKLGYVLSGIIASLMTLASISGILFSSTLYPTDELAATFISNDLVNLFIGLPIIIVSFFLTIRKKLIGLLFLPGAIFYVFYNYLIYIFAMPFNIAFILHLILVAISLYTTLILIETIDGAKIKQKLSENVYEKITGGILVAMGLLFILQVFAAMFSSIINQTPIIEIDLAVHVSDFLISPALLIGGTLLWRRKEFGYVSGLGLLFQASMLFVGLIMFLIIQPILTSTPLLLGDLLVVGIMSLICFIPLGLFIRGVQG
jgi:hypothetical protein